AIRYERRLRHRAREPAVPGDRRQRASTPDAFGVQSVEHRTVDRQRGGPDAGVLTEDPVPATAQALAAGGATSNGRVREKADAGRTAERFHGVLLVPRLARELADSIIIRSDT